MEMTPAGPVPMSGAWVMVQRWHDLLFAHWRCPIGDLRPLIPPPLDIDEYDGSAWVGVVPFYMTGVRMRLAPPVPTANAFEELNVRTYVTLDGRPGVWFFSLDCASTLAVIGARIGAHLPYYRASMRLVREGEETRFHSDRWSSARPAVFEAAYRPVGEPFHAAPESLEHFLTERYHWYSSAGKRIWRGDIMHPRWTLLAAKAHIERNSMLAAAALRQLGHEPPLLHYSAFQDVRFWLPLRVR